LDVLAGLEDLTRMRYEVPDGVSTGITALIFPETLLVTFPIATGLAKLPVASDNSAVTTFEEENAPAMIYGMITLLPAQRGFSTVDIPKYSVDDCPAIIAWSALLLKAYSFIVKLTPPSEIFIRTQPK
jgi:hypothetical protein